MSSLYYLSAAALPTRQLIEICQHSQRQGCDWELWREKALIKHKIPHIYFDLARSRGVSGLQRWIEIDSYFRITRKSLFGFLAPGLGVYEPCEAMETAVRYNDAPGVKKIFPFLDKEKNKEISEHHEDDFSSIYALNQLYSSLYGEKEYFELERKNVENGIYPPNSYYNPFIEKERKYLRNLVKAGNVRAFNELLAADPLGSSFLYSTLESGRSDFFNFLMPLYFSLPAHFDVDLLPSGDFDYLLTAPPYIVLRKLPLTEEQIFTASVSGVNPKIVDFFRLFFRRESLSGSKERFIDGCQEKKKPFEAYLILQKWNSTDLKGFLGIKGVNIDFVFYIINQPALEKPFWEDKIVYGKYLPHLEGNIVALYLLLELFSIPHLYREARKIILLAKSITRIEKKNYPLTYAILKEKLLTLL